MSMEVPPLLPEEYHFIHRIITGILYDATPGAPRQNPARKICLEYILKRFCRRGYSCANHHPMQSNLLIELQRKVDGALSVITTSPAQLVFVYLSTILSLKKDNSSSALVACFIHLLNVINSQSADVGSRLFFGWSHQTIILTQPRNNDFMNSQVFKICKDSLQKYQSAIQPLRAYSTFVLAPFLVRISDDIDAYSHLQSEQRGERDEKNKCILDDARNIFQAVLSSYTISISVYGSAANTLGSEKSDLDLSISAVPKDLTTDSPDIRLILSTLRDGIVGFSPVEDCAFDVKELILDARVPILKLFHRVHCIDVDICVGNENALLNTKLLREYADFDPRVRPLILAVKLWASRRGCNYGSNGTLTSYAWVLMVINFLQCSCCPPVLPNLLQPGTVMGFDSTRNTQSLAELFFYFFYFYCFEFDVASDVVSVKHAMLLMKRSAIPRAEIRRHRPDLLVTELDNESLQEVGEAVDSDYLEHEKKPENALDRRISLSLESEVTINADAMWRMSIEDPFEIHDLGRVLRDPVGQVHIFNEMYRVLLEITLAIHASSDSRNRPAGIQVAYQEALKTGGAVDESGNDLFGALVAPCNNVPVVPFICRSCGLDGHGSKDCPFFVCFRCFQQGHVSRDCLGRKCFSCNQPGHIGKECPLLLSSPEHQQQSRKSQQRPPRRPSGRQDAQLFDHTATSPTVSAGRAVPQQGAQRAAAVKETGGVPGGVGGGRGQSPRTPEYHVITPSTTGGRGGLRGSEKQSKQQQPQKQLLTRPKPHETQDASLLAGIDKLLSRLDLKTAP